MSKITRCDKCVERDRKRTVAITFASDEDAKLALRCISEQQKSESQTLVGLKASMVRCAIQRAVKVEAI